MNNIRALYHTVQELLYILNRKQKQRAIVVLLLLFVRAGLELIGIAILLPLLQMMLTPQKMLNNVWIGRLMRLLHIQSEVGVLFLIGGGVALVYVIKNVFILFTNYVQFSFSTGFQKEISLRMFNSYLKRPYNFYLDINSSEILRGCSLDVSQTYLIIENLFVIIAETIMITVIGVYIICADPAIALTMVALMMILMLIMILGFKPIAKRAGQQNMEANNQQNKALYQAIMGIKEIMVLQKKQTFVDEYGAATELARKASRKNMFISSCPDRIVEGVCASALVLCVCIKVKIGTDAMEFVPVLGTFAMAAFKMLPSIGKITSRMTGIIYARPYLKNLYTNIREVDEYENSYKKGIKEGEEEHKIESILDCMEFQNQLKIRNVTWKYQGQENNVLNQVSFNIRKGESVALIGASGAGKTTLADIILGLLKPQEGTVEVDGIDIFTIPVIWAQIVGYVPQMVFLKDDTIRNNVAFGIKEEEINDNDIWHSLEQAQLKDFVEKLPHKLDTIVGERGIKFSGGQRQRVAIARALYHKPQILVLDEATAALDNETEKAVIESIDALQGSITLIIVAHRLTTIKNCDTIYEIKDGKAVRREKEEVVSS